MKNTLEINKIRSVASHAYVCIYGGVSVGCSQESIKKLLRGERRVFFKCVCVCMCIRFLPL